MQDIKISNGYLQLWATYLRDVGIEPLTADFLQDVHDSLVTLIDQPFDTQVPLELLNHIILTTRQHLNCPQL
ncbi:MAG: AraC family transcriptional regulator, partial [Acinetobacter pseudolwoffii]